MEVSRRGGMELTPLWESVQRYSRLPEQTDPGALFAELAGRLSAPEWEVRQHGLRVLADVIPVLPAQRLDALMIPGVLTETALNLGHPAPGVRKSAAAALLVYLRVTSDPEFVLRSVVTVGLDSPTADPALVSNVISQLPTFIDNTLGGGESISHQSLVHLITSVSKKLARMSTQKEALDALSEIRDRVGEERFDRFLENHYPEVKKDLDVLRNVYQGSDTRDSGIDIRSVDERDSSSPKNVEDGEGEENEGEEDDEENVEKEETEEVEDDSGKIIIQEEMSFEDGSVVVTVVEEDVEEDKKTPRRVRFGGEVVKVRTPDSDVTIDTTRSESLERSNSVESEAGEEQKAGLLPPSFAVVVEKKRPSGIPLPVAPALHMPHARRRRFTEPPPSWEESLTSSSEGETGSSSYEGSLPFLPPHLQQLINNKDDARGAARGLESLSELRLQPREWTAVVGWLAGRLSEPRPARLLAATLRALAACLPRVQPRALLPLVPWLVPALARRLSSVPLQAKLEAATALQALMRQVGPAPVVKVLVSERGLTARSSKLRENSLLGLLYALMTYPSSEFDTSTMAEKILAMAPKEPKRRVRQAILEALAVLAVTRGKLVTPPGEFGDALNARLSRRLLPAVSPEGLVLYALHIPPMNEVSEYFLENFVIKEESDKWKHNLGRDVDWVLSGSGSLSSGSARSRSQLDLAQRDVYSSSRDVFSNWSKDDMMAIGTALPPRNFTYSHNHGEDRYYDQVWAAEPRQTLFLSSSQSSTRPLYLRYQNGQSDLQRGNVPEQGFPQLSSSYNSGVSGSRRGNDLNQTWSGSRWGESPPHVSINQSLPPIDWRAASRWQPLPSQVDLGHRIVVQDDQRRIGRWSRRQDLPPYHSSIITPRSSGLRRSPVSRSESSLVGAPAIGSQSELVRSTPSLHQPSRPASRQATPSPKPQDFLVLENGDIDEPEEEPTIEEEKEEKEEIDEVTEEVTEVITESEVLPVKSPVVPEQMTLDEIDEIDEVDENANPVEDPEVGTPDSKSLGTPSSEFGSESSKTTETSGNTIESATTEKPRRRGIPRAIGLRSRPKNSSKERPPLFPTSLPPFENPKDAYLKTILQLENPEWEVVMQGLQGLVRLCRHHNKYLTASAHSVVSAMVHNIRNLRSQVSRGSCQASKEIFDSIGRFLDSEVEDLATALLSRTADTNKFLRGDALAALESMVDHSNPVRSVGILTNKGAKHQNALVRCATSHLLLRLTKRLGPERCLSLPKESRDALILTGAKLLTEGSLETRRYAKEIFQNLSADPRLLAVMSEVVPNNLLRNISKVLSKIAITGKK